MSITKSLLLIATIAGLILFSGCSNQPSDNQEGTTDTLEEEMSTTLDELKGFMRALDTNVNLRTQKKDLNDTESVVYTYDGSELLKVKQTRDLESRMEVSTFYLTNGQVAYAGYFTADKNCENSSAYCLSEERYYFNEGNLIDSGQRSRIIAKSDMAPGSESQLESMIKTVDFTAIEGLSGDYFADATNQIRTLKLRSESAPQTQSGGENMDKATENTSNAANEKEQSSQPSQNQGTVTKYTKETKPKGQPFKFNDRGESTVGGRIKGGRTYTYMFSAEKGQQVNLTLEQLLGPGHFKVETRGAEIYNSYQEKSLTWDKTLARAGDYYVTIFIPEALADKEGDDFRYSISISLQ